MKTHRSRNKKIIAVILSVCLAVSRVGLFPAPVFAATNEIEVPASNGAVWTGFASCESGGEGFRQAAGDSGHAYGVFQFDDRYDLWSFIATVLSEFPEFSGLYSKYSSSSTPISSSAEDTATMIQIWHNAYDSNPDVFAELQLAYFLEEYYTPLISYCSARGIDIQSDDYTPVIRGTLWSISIWAGTSGAKKIIDKLSSSMTELEMLDICYSMTTVNLKSSASSAYYASFVERWTNEQKNLAAQAYTKFMSGSEIPTTDSDNLISMLAGAGFTYGIDGGTYIDNIKQWIDRYADTLAKGFINSGGWNTANKEWCEAIRTAGDWYELYGIIGGGEYINFSSGTSGGIVIGSGELSGQNGEIPDNGGSMPIVYFSQGGGQPWSSFPFGGGTIASSGCSITSLAMVVSYLTAGTSVGNFVYPSDIWAMIKTKTGNYNYFYTGSSGQSWAIMSAVAGYYGLSCSEISGSSIVAALSSGMPVIMSCVPGEFTNGGHFIVLTGLTDNGYIVVNDPAHPDKSYNAYSASYIISQGKAWWAFS